MAKPTVIAEIGCNHKGDVEIAKEMIKMAAIFGNADYVKFQKRCNEELLSTEQYNAPHPNPVNSYGDTYGAHREYLEFTPEVHKELKATCEDFGIGYSTSVWETTSARQMAALEPALLKVPSASNTNMEMLCYLCDSFGGEIHVSLGMTTQAEEEAIVKLFQKRNRSKDLVLYACTSGYPVPFTDLCLREITRLKGAYEDVVKDIGFSGHHLGIAADIAAIALGANLVERHFTLDRTWKGTDHAASLEPDGLRRLVRDVKAVHDALRYKPKEILDIEEPQREKLKWRTETADTTAH